MSHSIRHFINLVESAGSHADTPPPTLYEFIESLTPDDVGREEIDNWTIRFEGFSEWCISDAQERCELPADDPRHLASFEDVHQEILRQWTTEEGTEPVDYGLAGDTDNPVQWAIFLPKTDAQ
jgi:hypothetical protein